jgi:diacylglycerol kinase (ATP)
MTRAVLVVNATKLDAEGIKTLQSDAVSAFAAAGWPEPELRLTTQQDPGGDAAREAVRDGAQLVVACGGDGTVNAVAEALADTGRTMGIVPLGTGNLLAGNLSIPTTSGEAIKVLTAGADRTIDLGSSGNRVFAGMAGLGLDAAMVADAPTALKKRIGWPAYLVSILRHLPDRGVVVTVEMDGRRVRHWGVRTLLIGNIGRVQGGLDLLPAADPADGLLDAVVLAPRGLLLGWLTVLFRLVTSRSRSSDTITRYQARHIVAHCSRAVDQELDGEPYRRAPVLDVEVRPGALRVRVPNVSDQPRATSGSNGTDGSKETSGTRTT